MMSRGHCGHHGRVGRVGPRLRLWALLVAVMAMAICIGACAPPALAVTKAAKPATPKYCVSYPSTLKSIRLAWSAVKGASKYEVYVKSGGSWKRLAATAQARDELCLPRPGPQGKGGAWSAMKSLTTKNTSGKGLNRDIPAGLGYRVVSSRDDGGGPVWVENGAFWADKDYTGKLPQPGFNCNIKQGASKTGWIVTMIEKGSYPRIEVDIDYIDGMYFKVP